MTQEHVRSRRRVALLAAVGFLQLTATLVTAACLAADAAPPSRPPNVVLIVSDDQHWRDYGFMGHPHLRTPRLDRLARESLVFPRGYVTSSLCCPSLASIITGRYPHEHRIVGNDPPGGKAGLAAGRERMNRHLEEWPTLPRLLATKVLIERWRQAYNTVRPHSALGYRPPAPEARQPCAAASATPQRPHRAGLSEGESLT